MSQSFFITIQSTFFEFFFLLFLMIRIFCLFQTYNSDAQIGESSACATALMCGVKANFETLGLDTRGKFENCLSSFSSKVPSLIDWAQEEGELLKVMNIQSTVTFSFIFILDCHHFTFKFSYLFFLLEKVSLPRHRVLMFFF